MKTSLELLLPTFNGSRYLPGQLDSLCNQAFSDFSVLTYDDGSKDDSLAVVDKYADRLDIKRIPNSSGNNMGAIKSFELLLNNSSAECVMFCDQDDIWERNRIQRGIMKLTESMERFGAIPLAVFSDLSLISGSNDDVKGSFLGLSGFNPAALFDPYYLAFRNPAPGCAMTVNRSLINVALPFQSTVLMHDWWLMLCASLTGKIIFIDGKLIRYRVHQSNTLGIAHDRPLHPLQSILSLLRQAKFRSIVNRLEPGLRQAETVFQLHGKHFSRVRFWKKLIAGRYIFPTIAKRYRPAAKYSWKSLPEA